MKTFSLFFSPWSRFSNICSVFLSQIAVAVTFTATAQAAIDIPNAANSVSKAVPRSVKVDAVEVQLVSNYDGQAPEGRPLKFAVLVKHDPHWHTYWRNAGDSGLPTQIDWKLPVDWQVSGIDWPVPKRISVGPLVNFGYEGQLLLPVTVTLPKSGGNGTANSGTQTILAKVQWLMCKDVCIPGEADLALALHLGEVGKATEFKPLFDDAQQSAIKAGIQRLKAVFADEPGGVRLRVTLGGPNIAIATMPGQEIDFFPYLPEIMQPASPLKVFAEGNGEKASSLRLETKWVEGLKLPDALEGLLIVNGQGFEVAARKVASWVEPKDESRVVSEYTGPKPSSNASGKAQLPVTLPDTGKESLLVTLALAFFGGLILNLMPCVFPVLGLKILGFAANANEVSKTRLQAAVVFAAGVIVSFWILSLLMIGLQAAGQAVGWGFQLQSPLFVSLMAWLFALIGLNLSGVFEVGIAMTRASFNEQNAHSKWSELGSGALAVLVATPCTAPFMGAALGATLGQSIATQLAVFTMIGVGMALPYVVLTLLPGFGKLLPKPGAWMQTFKQFLAFPMFATAAWLVWVYGQQLDVDAVLMLLFSLVAVGFAAWMYGLWQRQAMQAGASSGKALFLLSITLVAVASGVALIGQTEKFASSDALPKTAQNRGEGWEPWSTERVDELLAQGRPVFVDFTAAWCVSCQVNKKAVLERATIKQFFSDQKVALLRADWTKRDSAITAELSRYKRNGVPMYQVWLPTAGVRSASLLPEILTQDIVLSAFK
jgi:thiol:disulfide interchange protein/DsbC/DsbD-like thiol-disulfide interchange protein